MSEEDKYHHMYDFGRPDAQTYTEACKKCGKTHAISSQKEGGCCLLELFIRCDCGASVKFELPVDG